MLQMKININFIFYKSFEIFDIYILYFNNLFIVHQFIIFLPDLEV